MSTGKVQVVVRSRNVPVGVAQVSRPSILSPGMSFGSISHREIIYETRLEEDHVKAIEDGRRLADQLGLKLEIIDESRLSLARRVLTLLVGGLSQSPKLVITPSYAPVSYPAPCTEGLRGAV